MEQKEIEELKENLKSLFQNVDSVPLAEQLCQNVLQKSPNDFRNEMLEELLQEAGSSLEYGVYVSDYATQNYDAIGGAWFYLGNYSDNEEFMSHVNLYLQMLDALYPIEGATREEIVLCRCDGEDDILPLFMGRYSIKDEFFEYLELVSNFKADRKRALLAYMKHIDCGYNIYNMRKLFSNFEESYEGKYGDDDDNSKMRYACYRVESTMELPEYIERYFDYKKFANDLFITDYCCHDGHIFRVL